MTIIGEIRDFEPFLLSRRNFYQFLALLFTEPKANPLFGDLNREIDMNGLEEVHKNGGRKLRQFFHHLSKQLIHEQIEEFHRLFIGPGMSAPPWESYYRSQDHLLFEDCMIQIRELFYQFGLQNKMENKEPDDHLSLELEFMVFLSEQSLLKKDLEYLKNLLTTQIDFLQEHLLSWIPQFCERIIQNTTSPFYSGAAMLLRDFCWFDLETLTQAREAL
ncbi:TorD/DmsD family molecular chaperone [Neobacillus dielmonensis]|uniref:TorD/DmsD family molecular chaperone n=1 Tax=Neobacillus dielmonensis TaxID=1347369 RepID=UPI000694679B|nr:molecular chaperone TorD family protein [Neobacillus dielmonensis]